MYANPYFSRIYYNRPATQPQCPTGQTRVGGKCVPTTVKPTPAPNPQRAVGCPPGYTMTSKSAFGGTVHSYVCANTSAVPKPARCPPGYRLVNLGNGRFSCTRITGSTVKANPNGACCSECADHPEQNPCGGGRWTAPNPHDNTRMKLVKAWSRRRR